MGDFMNFSRIIYPPLSAHSHLRQSMTIGEQRVFELFNRHLPPSWEIYIQPHLNGLRPDFVLLNPSGGIGVFEVKDWDLSAMRYYTQKDHWGFSLWAEKDGKNFCIQSTNPLTKVNLYKKEIYDLYCPRLKEKAGWGAITAGVIFPFARSSDVTDLLKPFLKVSDRDYTRYQPISGAEEIFAGDIKSIFPEALRSTSNLMSEARAEDLRGWLVEPDFSAEQRLPLILDRAQRILAETRTDSGYRRIKGPAGSGKSLVLAARAAKLANEGKSVLVATFNITLWHYLRDLIVRAIDAPEKLRNIRFTHFHLWCKHACYDVGWEKRYEAIWKSAEGSKERRDFILNEGMAQLAEEALEQPSAVHYDAIMVDEGQDYRPLWWSALRKSLKSGGEIILAADTTQDVYGTASAWTDDVMNGAGFRGDWSKLGASYRLPPKALELVCQYASEFLPKNLIDLPNDKLLQDASRLFDLEKNSLDLYPCHLRWVQCDPDDADKTCSDEVLRLMRETGKNGLANADITILTSDMASGEDVVKNLAEYRVNTVNTFGTDHRRLKMAFYMGDARVKATTIHSFKGWESRLLVVRVESALDDQSKALIYAGLTRLKRSEEGSWLTVICSAPNLKEFGKKFPDYVYKDEKHDFI